MPKSDARRIQSILSIWQKNNPDPKCELFHKTPFQLLVSVVLSAQTTDKKVNQCMEPIYEEGFGIDEVLKLKPAGILTIIKSIGLAPTKSKNVYKLAQQLRELHQDQIPKEHDELIALAGVGRKTANVVQAELFGAKTLAVDTHVFRVAARLGLHSEKTPDKAEKAILKHVPIKYLPKAHHWFILHGRYTCMARSPRCSECIIQKHCPEFEKNFKT